MSVTGKPSMGRAVARQREQTNKGLLVSLLFYAVPRCYAEHKIELAPHALKTNTNSTLLYLLLLIILNINSNRIELQKYVQIHVLHTVIHLNPNIS